MSRDIDLRGRVALVTGGTGGLGTASCRALAADGVNVVVADLPTAPIESLVAELRASGVRAEGVSVDLTDPAQAAGLVALAEPMLGPIDILVNNAGLEFAGVFADRSFQSIQAEVTVNLMAPLLLTRAVLPGMLERGSGSIVNISSVGGKITLPFISTYVATKFGLAAFSRALRAEVGASPVAIGSVFPGLIRTQGMAAKFTEQMSPGLVRRISRSPEDVGAAVVKVIRGSRVEAVVSVGPTAWSGVLDAVAPRLAVRLLARLRPSFEVILRRAGRI